MPVPISAAPTTLPTAIPAISPPVSAASGFVSGSGSADATVTVTSESSASASPSTVPPRQEPPRTYMPSPPRAALLIRYFSAFHDERAAQNAHSAAFTLVPLTAARRKFGRRDFRMILLKTERSRSSATSSEVLRKSGEKITFKPCRCGRKRNRRNIRWKGRI